ncbi:hypothetical protein [Acidithiobacillus sulfurivorans]|uniref:Uncharacterized protein n=1 Tax=Acidithiobacillus sulfurivorans TaxID=1958756 RepID=A0ABS5ZX56_9PROT|nr:hypothetical protein [Acidithiobacillus sulfurivorans]MBU2759228.1 hypothetical protein [Acidithiobacillus sulfurivorans]
MTVFWGCVKTSNDLKNHPFSQTKSRSQVSGSDIYSDFHKSVLLGKVFFARLPNIFIDLFQGEFFQSIEPAELHQYGVVCRIVLQVVFFEFIEFIHPLEVHEHLFYAVRLSRLRHCGNYA